MPLKMCSHSQVNMIRQCERRWYMHYGMKARINSRDLLLREIAFLKKLKSSFMWRGELVHSIVGTVLRRSRQGVVPLEQALQSLNDAGKSYWEDSLKDRVNMPGSMI